MAIAACLESLAPFLREPEGKDAKRAQDIFLINEFADFSDQNMVLALRRFFDPDDELSLNLKHCGIAMVGFDSDAYPGADETAFLDEIHDALKLELPVWLNQINSRVISEELSGFDIHFICVPLSSAEAFRSYFLELLGVAK